MPPSRPVPAGCRAGHVARRERLAAWRRSHGERRARAGARQRRGLWAGATAARGAGRVGGAAPGGGGGGGGATPPGGVGGGGPPPPPPPGWPPPPGGGGGGGG